MKEKVDFIEMIWDNYQGASGKPIQRSILIDIPATTLLGEIENYTLKVLTDNGIKKSYDPSEYSYPYSGIISITILPTFNKVSHDR